MPVCTLARARRQFIFVLITLLFLLIGLRSAHAQVTASYVEFLVGDRTEETRKWGHVSLRVVGGGIDKIFDFGRYGKMWGRKDSAEGEPILRVWNHGQFGTYRALHLRDGGNSYRFRFESDSRRNKRILSYFERMINGARRAGSNSSFTAHVANYATFHAVKVNCTTVTIEAFTEGFPEYDLREPSYATARTLQWYMLGEAQQFIYDLNERRWTQIWWPMDLMALLQEQYVAKGRARVAPL